PAGGLCVMIGAIPHTGWLPDEVRRDRHGFILTGRDLAGQDRAGPDRQAPLALETSLPGVFAVGDVRAGSGQRGASAVGGGSVAIPPVHAHPLRAASRAALYAPRRGLVTGGSASDSPRSRRGTRRRGASTSAADPPRCGRAGRGRGNRSSPS